MSFQKQNIIPALKTVLLSPLFLQNQDSKFWTYVEILNEEDIKSEIKIVVKYNQNHSVTTRIQQHSPLKLNSTHNLVKKSELLFNIFHSQYPEIKNIGIIGKIINDKFVVNDITINNRVFLEYSKFNIVKRAGFKVYPFIFGTQEQILSRLVLSKNNTAETKTTQLVMKFVTTKGNLLCGSYRVVTLQHELRECILDDSRIHEWTSNKLKIIGNDIQSKHEEQKITVGAAKYIIEDAINDFCTQNEDKLIYKREIIVREAFKNFKLLQEKIKKKLFKMVHNE